MGYEHLAPASTRPATSSSTTRPDLVHVYRTGGHQGRVLASLWYVYVVISMYMSLFLLKVAYSGGE
jgi:hypothetical protein